MPHTVDIFCPQCSKCALFEFAEAVRIREKNDVSFFENSKDFEYRFLRDSSGAGWHAAVFYFGLHGTTTSSIRELPLGYEPANWDHSSFFYRSHRLGVGTAVCLECGLRQKHTLRWPEEAFYSIEYRRHLLWAFNREYALKLRTYVATGKRNINRDTGSRFLLHIPKEFLFANARETIVKRLDALIRKE